MYSKLNDLINTIFLSKKTYITVLSTMFFYCIFFPYITLVPLGFDVQPYALLVSVFVFFTFGFRKFPLGIILLFFLMCFAFSLVPFVSNVVDTIKSLIYYLTLFFVAAASYQVLKANNGISLNTIKHAIYIWFAVGLVQMFVYNEFLTFMLPRANGIMEGGRGVISLAPEPTFYAIISLFFLYIVIHHKNDIYKNAKEITIKFVLKTFQKVITYRKSILNVLILILCFEMFVIAKSSTIIILFVIYISMYLIIFHNMKRIMTTILVMAILVLCFKLFYSFYEDSRIVQIINLLQEDPTLLLKKDISVNGRVGHILFSFLGFWDNHFLPHAYGNFSTYALNKIPTFGDLFSPLYYGDGARINSAYGAALFELGFGGLLLPISMTLSVYHYYKDNFKKFLFYSGVINVLMFNSISLALPFIGFLIGFMYYYGSVKDKTSLTDNVL